MGAIASTGILHPMKDSSAEQVSGAGSDFFFLSKGGNTGTGGIDVIRLYTRMAIAAEEAGVKLTLAKQFFINKTGQLVQAYYIGGRVDEEQAARLILESVNDSFDVSRFWKGEPSPPIKPDLDTDSVLVNEVSGYLQVLGLMRPLYSRGREKTSTQGDILSGNFTVFGSGTADKQYVLGFLRRLLSATRHFQNPVVCMREYKLRRNEQGHPKLVFGYSITATVTDVEEYALLQMGMETKDTPNRKEIEEVVILVNHGGKVIPSPEGRNAASAAFGNDGMGGVHEAKRGFRR